MSDVGPVDGSFVATRGAEVQSVAVDDGVLLVDERAGRVLPLNTTGALVWECFDGVSPLTEICADLAEGLAVAFDTVLDDVAEIVRGLLERGMVTDQDGAPPPSLTPPAVLVPAGPAASFATARTHALSVEVNGRVSRVRSNDRAMLELLGAAVGTAPDDEVSESAELSLLFGAPRGAIEPLHFLYRGDELVFRTVDRGRLLRAALAHLDAAFPSPPGTTRLNGQLLVRSTNALVVGGAFLEMLELDGSRLARRGWRLADTGGPLVDTTTFDVVTTRTVPRDASGVARIDRTFPLRPDEVRDLRHRYRVVGLVMVGSTPEAEKLATRGQRLAAQVPLVRWLTQPLSARDVTVVRELSTGHLASWVSGLDDQELLNVLDGIVRDLGAASRRA